MMAELRCTCSHGESEHRTPTYFDRACRGFLDPAHAFADPDLVYAGERGCTCEGFTLAPTDTEPEPFAIPDGWAFLGLGTCRSCGQAIAWALTPNDRRAPVDRDGRSHFATCPSADAWRHRERPS